MLNDYDEWLLRWITMTSDSYAEWLLRWVIKMTNMLHRFTSSAFVHRYLNTWKEKTILFNAYFIDARSSTDLSQLFSEKVIRLDDILDFSFVDTWILEKRRQFYSAHTSLTHDCSQTWVKLNAHSLRLRQIYLQFEASLRRWFLFKSLSSIHLIFAKKTSWDETCTWIERSSKDYDCMILYYVKWLLRWVTIMLNDYDEWLLCWMTITLND